jgi:hypothetical protein
VTGREVLAVRGDDDAAHGVVGRCAVERMVEAIEHLQVLRIRLVRAVEHDSHDALGGLLVEHVAEVVGGGGLVGAGFAHGVPRFGLALIA